MKASALVALAFLAACAVPPAASPTPATIAAPAPPPPAPVAFRIESASVPTEVMKPEGNGPFPAIVMLHDCSGLGPKSSGAPRRWAREMVARGYVVAIPDSFTTRGFPAGVCTDPSPARADVGPFRRVPDAYEALDHLRALPYVDATRIGVMGGSHGGASTLATIVDNNRDDSPRLHDRKMHGFAAAIAFYPGCQMGRPSMVRWYHSHVPLLILAGELDDWTPAAPCVDLVKTANGNGSPAEIKVYPNAHHAFDSRGPVRFVAERNNANAPGGKGATTGGNTEAWVDSIHQVETFFAKYLQPRG
jgi:dienelactone hydrolase